MRSTRRSAAPRWKRASTKSPPASPTSPCANITGRIFRSGCGSFLRRRKGRAAISSSAAKGTEAVWPAELARRANNPALPAASANFGAKRPEVGSRNTPYVVVSQQLASSPLHRGFRTAVPLREALILQAALNHPWLLHDHLEELATLEFRHPDAERLKAALIDIAAHAPAADSATHPGGTLAGATSPK